MLNSKVSLYCLTFEVGCHISNFLHCPNFCTSVQSKIDIPKKTQCASPSKEIHLVSTSFRSLFPSLIPLAKCWNSLKFLGLQQKYAYNSLTKYSTLFIEGNFFTTLKARFILWAIQWMPTTYVNKKPTSLCKDHSFDLALLKLHLLQHRPTSSLLSIHP